MTKKQDRFLEETKRYYITKLALEQRLSFAAEVIRNTRNKLTISLPEELNWSYWDEFTDFRVINAVSNILRKETDEQIKLDDFLQFTRKDKKYTFPLRLLTNDPVSVAQYVRKLSRETHENERTRSLAQVEKELATLKERQEMAQSSYEKLQQERLKAPSSKK